MRISAGNFILDLSTGTKLMGIVNLTPDSFSHDGLLQKSSKPEAHVKIIDQMVECGADIVDIGAESSRPGATKISVKEEINRLLPTLKAVIPHLTVPISIDSYKSDVILASLDSGASIINCIYGLRLTKQILRHLRDYNAAIVVMHMRGTPLNMHLKTSYKDLVSNIVTEIRSSVDFCLDFGLKKDKIIIDPGIGFAKTPQLNFQLIDQLHKLTTLKVPVMVGVSRKSFLGNALSNMDKDRLAATAAAVSVSIINGANVIRAHDVSFIKDVITTTDRIRNS